MRKLIAGNKIVQVHAHIPYGGAATPTNAREVLALPEVAGALVGGASLKAADFDAVVRAVDASEHP